MAIQSVACISITILLLCLVQVRSMPTCQLQGNLLKKTHHLLRDMGGNFPAQCQQDNVILAFPASAFNTSGAQQRRETTKAIHQTLERIGSLFADEDLPSAWDQKKLEDFLELVYRLTEESRCVSSSVDGDDGSETLKAFFDGLTGIVIDKSSSFCVWEVVRRELLSTLQFILKNHSDCLFWPMRT
ncbi:interferon alpha-14-like [Osmerus mordax]|uniref:interferon alpha-14-like n=1 Tax=Osmerus mordax TaxID=8014 RepID=UPI003510C1E3